jgi:spermidine dehydrogenase
MYRRITRRDFLNGAAMGLGVTLLPSSLSGRTGEGNASDYYPPALTGLRGSHPGSFEVAHSLRDGTFWDTAGTPKDTGEKYDLVVVGGGISGLAAAYYFRKIAGSQARILILDNHDDFGGHAKRNEFRAGSRTLLGYGGTFSIESPAPYSPVARHMIEELGIDVPSYRRHVDKRLYPSLGLKPRVFFDQAGFGADRLTLNPEPHGTGEGKDELPWREDNLKQFLADAPFSEQAKKDTQRLYLSQVDYMPGLSSDQKKARLARMSYQAFLADFVKVDPQVRAFLQAMPQSDYGVGFDAVSAQDAWGLGAPGFQGMKLEDAPGPGMGRDAIPNEAADAYFFHFPDGNSTIARELVRRLIPEVVPAASLAKLVTTRANYAKLDEPSSSVRLRLSSTVVRVRHVGDPARAAEVEITYAREGGVYTVRAKNSILACWHVVIPYLCDELPDHQKQALERAAKVPLVYTNVVLRDWKAFQKLGVSSVYAPNGYYSAFNLDLPVSIGDYQCPRNPGEPIVVHMMRTPCRPGRSAREQHRIGRMELFSTTFETFERKTREQLQQTLGPGGFDPATDITAITVNRWPHGYAYQYNSLWDPFWLEGGQTPCEVARAPFGRIAIANSDAGAYAYTDEAINQAWRAVGEITRKDQS